MKLALALALFALTLVAQSADDYRGGWKTEVNGIPRTYEFSIRGNTVRGVYCTWCADATTLAFVDGTFGPNGLTFAVTHVDNNGKTVATDKATAKFDKPNLVVTGTLAGSGPFQWTMTKDERGPDPLAIPIVMIPPREIPVIGRNGAVATGARASTERVGGGGRGAYVPPGPWLDLTPEIIVGSWLG